MYKIIKYSFIDTIRSRWAIIYFLFFLIVTYSLLYFSTSVTKSIVGLMNIVLTITPLISTVFTAMYFYNSKDFLEFLLSQPLNRKDIFIGHYLGMVFSLSLSFGMGLLIPFLFYGTFFGKEISDFSVLILCGILLSFIFSACSYVFCLLNNDKIKGFGISVLIWLFLSVIYDGILLMIMLLFKEYPLEKVSVIFTLLNPIDLSRVLILLHLDISDLMGYSAAVFKSFFDTSLGIFISFSSMLFWIIILIIFIYRISSKKDF